MKYDAKSSGNWWIWLPVEKQIWNKKPNKMNKGTKVKVCGIKKKSEVGKPNASSVLCSIEEF